MKLTTLCVPFNLIGQPQVITIIIIINYIKNLVNVKLLTQTEIVADKVNSTLVNIRLSGLRLESSRKCGNDSEHASIYSARCVHLTRTRESEIVNPLRRVCVLIVS